LSDAAKMAAGAIKQEPCHGRSEPVFAAKCADRAGDPGETAELPDKFVSATDIPSAKPAGTRKTRARMWRLERVLESKTLDLVNRITL
jgi:hypothetical protein